MMKHKMFVPFLLILALVLVFSIGPTAAQEEPLRIGLLTDTSGPLTIYGVEEENGFLLGLLYETGIDPTQYATIDAALADVTIAGRPVEVLIRDNASDSDTGASQARELIERDGVEVLVGTVSSGVTVQLQSIAQDFNVILMTGPAASPAITGSNFNVNTFRVCRNSYQDFLSYASYAKNNVGSNFIQLAADYEFGHASADAAAAVLGSAGINFVQDTIYAPTDTTDFTPYFQQLLDSGADAVVITWAGDSTVTLMQQLEELGVPDKMTVIVPFNSNEIVKAVPPPPGTEAWMIYHYTFPDNPINDWLVEKHRAVYNDVPDLFTECSFATAQALVRALDATSGDSQPDAMIPALEGMQFDGPKGTYTIRAEDHQALVPMYIAKLTNTDDPDFKFYDLLETIPAEDIVPPCLAGEDRCGPATQ